MGTVEATVYMSLKTKFLNRNFNAINLCGAKIRFYEY